MAILAAFIIPNVSTFLGSGKQAAANTEVQNVRTAATGFRSQCDGRPVNSANLTPFLSGTESQRLPLPLATSGLQTHPLIQAGVGFCI
jgi:hypothetical protein